MRQMFVHGSSNLWLNRFVQNTESFKTRLSVAVRCAMLWSLFGFIGSIFAAKIDQNSHYFIKNVSDLILLTCLLNCHMKSVSHFQSWGDGQLSALLVVRSCDVCFWTVFKCYKYKNTTFWNLTTVCQFSLFVFAALIDFRKRRSFVWFLLEKLRKPQSWRSLHPDWVRNCLFFHIRHLVALNCQKHPSKYLLRMRKMQKIEPSELIFMTDGSCRGCKRIKREVVFSFIYIYIKRINYSEYRLQLKLSFSFCEIHARAQPRTHKHV